MEIVLLTVGKTTIDFVLDGIAEYTKRLKHYIPYSIQMLPDIKKAASLSVERQK
ncbi:MAG: 23S rRNA (pseudouridine(1915)-N(3))-methyltransferase RlmH, partial [Muribaculaceae bacterium]|nr:23S rRNA (pseudouridine(1915)-N(3))-methyltransferase RlmH [Muribaculaceae bacterium]